MKLQFVFSSMVTLGLCIILLIINHQSQGQNLTLSPTDSFATPLRTLAQARKFYVGAAVALDAFQNEPQYQDTLSREYNMIVPENAMKWDALRPTQDNFDFSGADSLVAFAQTHNMSVRGHNLVWYNALPKWLSQGNFTRDQLLTILHDHIQTVVGHYKGQILDWDVVNEAIDDNAQPRDDIWLRILGPGYIDLAFQWAHEADPNAKLFYNDYNDEIINAKSDAIYALVKGMKARGVPIDGVGLQMHIGLSHLPKASAVKANMARFAALGLQVQITEMDVEIQHGVGSNDERLAQQATAYSQMLGVCLGTPACTAFLTWGFTDLHSWIPYFTGHPDAPLPFDTNYAPKPAYWAIHGTLSNYRDTF